MFGGTKSVSVVHNMDWSLKQAKAYIIGLDHALKLPIDVWEYNFFSSSSSNPSRWLRRYETLKRLSWLKAGRFTPDEINRAKKSLASFFGLVISSARRGNGSKNFIVPIRPVGWLVGWEAGNIAGLSEEVQSGCQRGAFIDEKVRKNEWTNETDCLSLSSNRYTCHTNRQQLNAPVSE